MICPRLARSLRFMRRALRYIIKALNKKRSACANLVEVKEPLAYEDACASDPRCLNDTIFLFRTSDQSTRPPHLDALRNPPSKTSIRLRIVVREQSGQCTVRASSRWIFRYATQRCEHPRTNVKTVAGAGV